MPSSKGSAQVEAALIIPLVILIIAGMINLCTALFGKTAESSAEGSAAASVLAEGGAVPTESILRGRWLLK